MPLILSILIIIIITPAMVEISLASPTSVYVDPQSIVDLTLKPGAQFTIDLDVDYVVKLWSYQLTLSFNPEVLYGVSVENGPFLESAGGAALVVPGQGWNNTEGTLALFGAALFPVANFPTGGSDEYGPLATITFEVVGFGISPITLGPETGLANETGGWIIHKKENPEYFVDGYFNNNPVHIDPPQARGVPVGESFMVNVTTGGNVEDLYSWEFYMNWSAPVLNVTSVVEGDFLKSQPDGTTFYHEIHNDQAFIYANCTRTEGTGVTGNGTLATVTFLVEDNGNSTLHLYDTLFSNSTSQQMLLDIADGWFTNVKHTLAIDSSPLPGVEFTLDGEEFPLGITTYTTPFSESLEEQYYTVTMPSRTYFLGKEHAFYNWSDDLTDPTRTVDLTEDISLTANYGEIPHVHNLNTTLDYMTIQEAIDAVETLDGHTILVDAGTYWENVWLNKSLKLVGENSSITIIDGSMTGDVIYVTAENVTIAGFTITHARQGINIEECNGHIIFDNIISSCDSVGIYLASSSNNTISNNVLIENVDSAMWLETSSNNTISNNFLIQNEYSAMWLDSSSNNTISNNVLIENVEAGIWMELSSNNTIYGNTILSTIGISLGLYDTEDNMIVGNTISNSDTVGVELSTSNDTIFHNNFLNNVEQVWDGASPTTWDNGFEGNYWSDYTGEDQNDDGIGDTDLPHQGVDYYPLMNPWPMEWSIVFEDETYSLTTASNSTVTYMKFSQLEKQITFNVTGPDGTSGFCNITIPKDLLDAPIDQWAVLVNGTQVEPDPIVTENATYTFIYFTYNHSTQEVLVEGTNPADSTPPVADAGSDQTVDEDIIVTFDGSGSTDNIGITSYIWTFLDVTPQTLIGVNPTYTFATPDIYTVTLNVSDARGNWDTDDVIITVLDVTNPVADAGPNQTVDEDTLVTLEGWRSIDNVEITGWTWTFTDVTPQTLTGENVTYTFETPGTYTITLNVSDAAGNWDTYGVVITVVDVTSPVADAGSDQTVDEDTLVTFDASGSSDNVDIVDYAWDFGDGTTGTGVAPTHTYTEPETYTVTLTVKDAAGNIDTDTVEITILDLTIPTADAGTDQTVKEGAAVTFDAGASSDNVGIVSYAWDFGDGTTGTGVAPTHTYTEPETYTVTLTVKDAAGNIDTDTMTVIVEARGGFPISIEGVAAIAIVIVIVATAVFVFMRRGRKH